VVGKQEGFCVLVDFIAHIEYELLGQYCFLKGDKVVYFLDKSLIEHHLYRRKWIIIIRIILDFDLLQERLFLKLKNISFITRKIISKTKKYFIHYKKDYF
jgi:hypothetical protein